MQRIDRHDRPALRRFGLALALLVAVLFGFLGPWLFDFPRPQWPLWTAGVLVPLAIAWPAAVYPVYRLVRPPLAALGWLNNWLLLGFVFFVVLWPYGVFARATRRLHFVTGFDRGASTYRIRHTGCDARDGPTNLDEPF